MEDCVSCELRSLRPIGILCPSDPMECTLALSLTWLLVDCEPLVLVEIARELAPDNSFLAFDDDKLTVLDNVTSLSLSI